MNARKYIEEALIELLKKKPIDKIKVSEVIREVGTCKGTFYKYYCDKYELLQSCFKNRVYSKASQGGWEGFMRACLEEFAKMPEETLNAFDSRDVNSLKFYHEALIVSLLERDLTNAGVTPSKIGLMSMRICASGYTEMTLKWLRSGCKESVDELLSYMLAAMPQSIYTQVTATA